MQEVGPRHLVALAMLLWASSSDLRTRRVPNLQWLPFAIAAGMFLASDLALGQEPREMLWPLATATLLATAAYMLFQTHLFGGADAKCLMVLAFLLPWPTLEAGLVVPTTASILLNASVAVLVLPALFLLRNVVAGDIRLPAALLGFPMRVERARAMHVWPMQRVDDAGRLRWRYRQRIGQPLDEAYEALRLAQIERVWITPKVPFMVPLAIGLGVHMVWGNVLLLLMANLVQP